MERLNLAITSEVKVQLVNTPYHKPTMALNGLIIPTLKDFNLTPQTYITEVSGRGRHAINAGISTINFSFDTAGGEIEVIKLNDQQYRHCQSMEMMAIPKDKVDMVKAFLRTIGEW